MRKFRSVLAFELKGYLKNRIFVWITLVLMIAVAGVLSYPRISELWKSDGAESPSEYEGEPALIMDAAGLYGEELASALSAATGVPVELWQDTAETLKEAVSAGDNPWGVIVTGELEYTYVVNGLGLFDTREAVIGQVLSEMYRLRSLGELGMDATEAAELMSAAPSGTVLNTGKDQTKNFIYTYVLIFALYMSIMLYGQLVANGVAVEKSSRAMEMLITSADSNSLMFGKILGSGIAGLIQLVAVFGSAILFYGINRPWWEGNAVVSGIFDMPVSTCLYMLLFFVLGFFIYAFLYGAVGSLASKLEDINTSTLPITFLFIAAFIITMIALGSGNMEGGLIKAASFIPFTSPMAMFVRITMGEVPGWQVAVSVALMAATAVFVGWLSARIYKVGALLYGTPPKLSAMIKAVLRTRA